MSKSHSTASGPRPEPSLDVRVAEAIADAKGVDPTDLPALYHELDLESMERLLENSDADLHVRAELEDVTLEIHGDEIDVS